MYAVLIRLYFCSKILILPGTFSIIMMFLLGKRPTDPKI